LVLADLWKDEAFFGKFVVYFSVNCTKSVEIQEAIRDIKTLRTYNRRVPLGLKHLSQSTFSSEGPVAHEGLF
jgi:hypothetical protein